MAEFPGFFAAAMLVDRIGRKKTMALLAIIAMVSVACLTECSLMSKWVVGVLLFCGRGSAVGCYQTLLLYTPEVYPTRLRALAMGNVNAKVRIWNVIDLVLQVPIMGSQGWVL